MSQAHDLLERLDSVARTNKEKGELFERFAAAYLRHDPYYGQRFSKVWRWSDWPGRGTEPDKGIDLVAEEAGTGLLWAIQAKFHEEKLQLDDIATFLALSGRKEFSYRMLITTSALGPNAEDALRSQEKPVVVVGLPDLLACPIDWTRFDWRKPDVLHRPSAKKLHPYQADALDAVVKGFARSPRGKLIMPPGAGKTFVSLRIAERLAGAGGFVLFLAPSIALVEQTLRAWLADATIPMRVFAVTSDYTVGREEEALDRTTVLTIPPTTNADELMQVVQKKAPDRLTVIVSTYHSIEVVAEAQRNGMPSFDLIIADEAHRTTGIAQGDEASYYHKVHDENLVSGVRRLYMTATPRVFVPRVKEKLEDQGFDFYTMDDESIYGEEFFRYGFGQAVDAGFLSDYRVLVFTVSEEDVQKKLFSFLGQEDSPEVEEAAKMIGVWSALSGRSSDDELPTFKRAVVFAGRIADSKSFEKQFAATAAEYQKVIGDETGVHKFAVRHVDGTMTASVRKELLAWLKEEPPVGETRILSNARVLTEGIDVPALDAVVFLKPRRSVVDVVQAVGRAMRKAPGKRYGYVVIPVIVNPNEDAARQLDRNEQFRTVWEVLGALRSIDDRFDALVRELSIQRKAREQGKPQEGVDDSLIQVHVGGEETYQPHFDFGDQLVGAIVSKLVERVGDRAYLETWARDVASATARIERHIDEALTHDSEYGHRTRTAFADFLDALRRVINPSVTEADARSMLVQHIITKPIFDALFAEYQFLKDNPIARSLDAVATIFEAFVQKETQTLTTFYRLVQVRARGLNKEAERQDFLRQLYDTFFKIAFPKTSERLGIVYTPVEIVDFLVKSADAVLKREFGLSLADEQVVVVEPFAGTGTFLTRLMRHLPKRAMARKYLQGEIWANEILLLPYYIALANVESTFFDVTGRHEPFRNLLLVDSFQLMEPGDEEQISLFPKQYTEAMERERQAKVNVVMSNPPWFGKQEDESLGIKAVKYPKLDEAIRETYVAHSSATTKHMLYDSYIRAIRLATDRIDKKGVIAFVTNGGFVDANNADGLRKTLAEEFAKIYVINLRGNAYLQGEAWKREGGKIFGQGSRARVALVLLVKDTDRQGPAEIYYHDIGDYLSREEKLSRLSAAGNLYKLSWETIKPNAAFDWISQRSEDFPVFPALGEKEKGSKQTFFDVYSRGLQSGRDVWAYNFSRQALEEGTHQMLTAYNQAVAAFQGTSSTPTEFISSSPYNVSWSAELVKDLVRGERHHWERAAIVPAMYRPFVRQWLYFHRSFNERTYQLPRLFPEPGLENLAIVVKGAGGTKPFSTLIVDQVPDLNLLDGGAQAFPFYSYEPVQGKSWTFEQQGDLVTGPSGRKYLRRENITDWIMDECLKRYGEGLTREHVFYYVYGLLHSPDYREKYENDLRKMLARVPLVKERSDFQAFSDAGRRLAALHLHYETVEPWPLVEEVKGTVADAEAFRITKMRFAKGPGGKDDRSTLLVNEQVTLREIPLRAYDYVVNGKSPVEWAMERYQATQDKASGIVNDPNAWATEHGDSRYIIGVIKRLVRVSVETLDIMDSLPRLS